jgi:hypothetical protein
MMPGTFYSLNADPGEVQQKVIIPNCMRNMAGLVMLPLDDAIYQLPIIA